MAERALRLTSVQEKRLQSLGNLVASLKKGVTYAILVSGALLAVSPLIWMISTSLMSLGEAQGVRLVPSTIHFENYTAAWQEADLAGYFITQKQFTESIARSGLKG